MAKIINKYYHIIKFPKNNIIFESPNNDFKMIYFWLSKSNQPEMINSFIEDHKEIKNINKLELLKENIKFSFSTNLSISDDISVKIDNIISDDGIFQFFKFYNTIKYVLGKSILSDDILNQYG